MKNHICTISLLLILCFCCSYSYGQQKDTLWKGKNPTLLLQKAKNQKKVGAILFGIGAAMMGWVLMDYYHGNPRDEGATRAAVFVAALPITATGITLFTIGSIKKHKANLLLAYDHSAHFGLQPAAFVRAGLSMPLHRSSK